jgi:aryl-alcohol dehydrogenase-like predicted oxidoreductase
MTNRREFLQLTGGAALASMIAPSAADPVMATRPIPGTDEHMAIVGLGNSRAFIEGDVETSTRLLDTFLAHGGTYVDVSGQSRFTVGEIVRERKAQDRTVLGNYLTADDYDGLRQEVAALQEVQGDGPLDLSMMRGVSELSNRADEFRRLKDENLIRHVGIGRPNKRFYPGMMQLMEDGVVDFVQVNYSMMEPEAANELLPMAIDKNVAVVINRPFINGDYFSLVRGRQLPDWAAEFDCESWAQFSLKYILSHPAVNCVITETANPKHVLDNLGAGLGALPDAATRVKMRDFFLDLT